ncbi:MAG TPA: transposase [Bacteroidales bacterium]|nr:transposase [Bacteroidales bacterium]
MIRTSKHIASAANQNKLDLLNTLYTDYKELLQLYVKMILNEQLPQKSFLSSKELPTVNDIVHSQWKQVAYKQANETVKSLLKKTRDKTFKKYKYIYAKCMKNEVHANFTSKRFKELNINFIKRIPTINIQNVSIPIDNRLFDIKEGKTFDEFVRLKTPYFLNNKKRAVTINIPLKHHRQSKQFRDSNWTRKNTIQLKKVKNNFFLNLFWEKEIETKKDGKNIVGIDVGFKKLISSSSGVHYGQELNKVYDKISRKKQGSKKFKRALIERNELINFYVKEFISQEQPDEVVIESLKNVKHKSSGKVYKKTMNKLQRWSYDRTFNKLEQLSESKGFMIKKVNPAYTSQTCSKCGSVHKESRKGELYECINCGMKLDADYNAALNILQRGVYGPSSTKAQIL